MYNRRVDDGPRIGRWKTPKLRILIEANDRAAQIVPELSRVLRRCPDGMWEEIGGERAFVIGPGGALNEDPAFTRRVRRQFRNWPRTQKGQLRRLIEIGRAYVEGT